MCATTPVWMHREHPLMSRKRRGDADTDTEISVTRMVGLVTTDDSVRLAAARAFDAAPANWGLRFMTEPSPGADHLVYGPDRPAGLEPRFDPKDPATLLPAQTALRAGTGVGVMSAVGGAGVTTIAAHLAAAFRHPGRAVLVEPDGKRALSIRFGVPGDAVIWEAGESVEVSVPVAGGSRLLRAGELAPALAAIDEAGRVAVADLGMGDGAAAVLKEGLLRAVVVVVPPSRPAARLTRDLLQHLGDVDRIIVSNRTGHGGDMTADKISAVIGAPIGLELPCTPSLRAAEDSGQLVQQPWSRWWRNIRRLAETLETTWTR